jgi:hypothetical protein
VGGHDGASLGRRRILTSPEARHRFLLSVEHESRLAVEGIGTATGHGLLISSEGEHRELSFLSVTIVAQQCHGTYWDGNGHIDADLASLNLALELARRGTGPSENGRSVAVLVLVDELNRLIYRLNVQTDENRPENFLRVALHVGLHIGDDGGADLGSTVRIVPRHLIHIEGDAHTQLPSGYFGGF